MNFNKHSYLSGSHALLSPSSYSWVNYDIEKLKAFYRTRNAMALGTKLHDFAANAIDLKQKMPRTRKTINMYVNDAIGFKMKTEQTLFANINCHGTADAISFRDNLLRIHDLKTGTSKASMTQLEIYAALFCIEYKYHPNDIKMELRIYQSDDVEICEPAPEKIIFIMDKIREFDDVIFDLKMEE